MNEISRHPLVSATSNVIASDFRPDVGCVQFASNPLESNSNSQHPAVEAGYATWKFNVGSEARYVWAQPVKESPYLNSFRIVDDVFADRGDAILAGQVAEPASLLLLALGVAGLLACRHWRLQTLR